MSKFSSVKSKVATLMEQQLQQLVRVCVEKRANRLLRANREGNDKKLTSQI